MKKFLTCLVLMICSTGTMFSQTYYTAADDDSVTYVAAMGKLVVLKRDSDNNLNLVKSITINDIDYHSSAVSTDYLLLTSEDTAYVFDISVRLNPVYLTKKYLGNIARGESFGENFIIIKRDASGHSVIGINSDTIKIYAALDRICQCFDPYPYGNMCTNLTFSYPYVFYRFSYNLLETWEYDDQTEMFYLLALDDYTPPNYEQFQISSSDNYVFLLLCKDLGGGYYTKYINKMSIESDTLIQQGVINQQSYVPTVGGDWDISEGFHRIVSNIYKFNTQSYDDNYSYNTNISLLANPPPIITDNHVYQCGSNFYYDYRIKADSIIFKEFTLPSSIDPGNEISQDFLLLQNYPNPFNPVTNVSFVIGHSSFVTLRVYDLLGNEIATLVDEEKPAGSYKVKFDGNRLASGIYFYRIKAGDFTAAKKFILLK